MKIRVKIPEHLVFDNNRTQHFIDDILLWGMETEMDIEFYSFYFPPGHTWADKRKWAVFSVEADYSYMFSLKWGATLHKGKNHDHSD